MDEIAKRYLSGETYANLSHFYNASRECIKERLIRHGVKVRSRWPIYDISNATNLYNQGKTLEQVAKEMGVTEWRINQDLKKAKVQMRDNYHPLRREQSRRIMTERMKTLGYIRMGKHEPKFCEALRRKYKNVIPQYTIEKGGHHFDALADGILWELDEKEHQTHTERKTKDMKYDTRAKELGYEVRHVWEWDFFESGLEKWHTLV